MTSAAVIENRWIKWAKVAERGGHDLYKSQLAVLNAGASIKNRLGLRREPFQFRGSGDGLEFQAVGLAGTLSLREVSLEIAPKFVPDPGRIATWNTSTLFLLETLAGRHVISLLADRQQWKSHRVLDLIARAFADAVERGMRDQPIHAYRQIEESAVALRGRLNLTRQLKNMVQAPHLLECDVDQLDVDNPYNDVLKWAATSLAASIYEPALSARLRVLAEALPGRADRSQAHRYIRLTPPPQFQLWEDALELARLLAGGLTLSSSGGKKSGYSLLFNMERAFERFIEYGLARTLRAIDAAGTLTSSRQQWTRYAQPVSKGARTLYCRPDNVIKRNGKPVLVVDAKYKLLDVEWADEDAVGDRSTPLSSDMYELLAGVVANSCTRGVLVYPSSTTQGEKNSHMRAWKINAYGKDVEIYAIPIHLLSLISRASFNRVLEELAQQVARLIDAERAAV